MVTARPPSAHKFTNAMRPCGGLEERLIIGIIGPCDPMGSLVAPLLRNIVGIYRLERPEWADGGACGCYRRRFTFDRDEYALIFMIPSIGSASEVAANWRHRKTMGEVDYDAIWYLLPPKQWPSFFSVFPFLCPGWVGWPTGVIYRFGPPPPRLPKCV